MLSCAPKPMSRFIDARNLNYILSYLQGQPGSLTQFQISWVAWLVYVWHLIWQFSCVPPPKFGMLLIRFPPWWAHLPHHSQSLLISSLVTVTSRHISFEYWRFSVSACNSFSVPSVLCLLIPSTSPQGSSSSPLSRKKAGGPFLRLSFQQRPIRGETVLFARKTRWWESSRWRRTIK